MAGLAARKYEHLVGLIDVDQHPGLDDSCASGDEILVAYNRLAVAVEQLKCCPGNLLGSYAG